jgi:hypothetical protein
MGRRVRNEGSEMCTFPAALIASWMLASMKMSLESLYPGTVPLAAPPSLRERDPCRR